MGRPFVIFAGGMICLLPIVSPPMALALGIFIGLFLGNPAPDQTRKWTHRVLSLSIVGLGAGMDLSAVAHVGVHGFFYTALGITLTLLLGRALGRSLGTEENVSNLITAGTAICGGSAIAALAPVIRAKPHEVSISLATVFILNSVALLVFPWIGHAVSLNQSEFGLWSALAIHDTSSVVGAALQFGPQALEIATTVKLARALWIIPVTLAFSAIRKSSAAQANEPQPPRKLPWFIFGFIIAAALATWIPSLQPASHVLASAAKRTLVLALFLIGTGVSRQTLRNAGMQPFVQGLSLWMLVAGATLFAISQSWIQV